MKSKEEKKKIIRDLNEKFKLAKGYLLVNLFKLNAPLQKKIRDLLRENNALFQVVKKTLIYKSNPNFPFSDEELKLPFGIIWNFDENFSCLSALKKLKKEGVEIDFIKGYFEKRILEKKEIDELINLLSKDELILKLLQNLKGSIFKLIFNLEFSLKKLILILSAIKKSKI